MPAWLSAAAVAACGAGSTKLLYPAPEQGTGLGGPEASLPVVAAAVAAAVVVLRAADGRAPGSVGWGCVLRSSAALEPLMRPCPEQEAAGAVEGASPASAPPLLAWPWPALFAYQVAVADLPAAAVVAGWHGTWPFAV